MPIDVDKVIRESMNAGSNVKPTTEIPGDIITISDKSLANDSSVVANADNPGRVGSDVVEESGATVSDGLSKDALVGDSNQPVVNQVVERNVGELQQDDRPYKLRQMETLLIALNVDNPLQGQILSGIKQILKW